MDLASGTINYTPADIDILAINIQNDSGEYESSATIPTSGYVLSDTSYCDVNGEKDASIKITYENGKIAVNDISKKIKCYLYFDKYSAIDTIIGDTTNIEEKTEFTGIATAADTGIYSAPDDYGTSFYFRGLEGSLNNWVEFAGFYWRIIRINGNGTIRMIYSGTANGNPSSSNKTGTTTQINADKYMYNEALSFSDNSTVGYMMGINESTGKSTSYEQAHSNKYDSNAKKQVDIWYATYIAGKDYENDIDINTGFCNDRKVGETTMSGYVANCGYGKYATVYAPWNKVNTKDGTSRLTIVLPTFICSDNNRDLFTIKNANIGNKALIYPVGLITLDEAIFGGEFAYKNNLKNYLYTNQLYWTMSPSHSISGGSGEIFYITTYGYPASDIHTSSAGLRPVINLRADTQFTYNNKTTKGSETDPFIVI